MTKEPPTVEKDFPMTTLSRLSADVCRGIVMSLEALAYRMTRRAGSGPDGTARWFDVPVPALAETAQVLRGHARSLESASSSRGQRESALLAARSALSSLLRKRRVYHVPRQPKRGFMSWLDTSTSELLIDVNPSEVEHALGDVQRALNELNPAFRILAAA